MAITLFSALIIMAAHFLILYAGVAFIQDKRFFSSAPKENLDTIPDKKERFRGAHVIGWIIGILAILMFAGAFVLAAWDGVKNGFGFGRFFARFIASWSSTTLRSSTGCCSATRTFSRTSIRS